MHCVVCTYRDAGKKNSLVTGVPSGKLTKKLMYDLDKFIDVNGGGNNSSSNSMGHVDDDDDDAIEKEDEEFVGAFIHSRFRLELMVLAGGNFAE